MPHLRDVKYSPIEGMELSEPEHIDSKLLREEKIKTMKK